jgi:hypothetical protein
VSVRGNFVYVLPPLSKEDFDVEVAVEICRTRASSEMSEVHLVETNRGWKLAVLSETYQKNNTCRQSL